MSYDLMVFEPGAAPTDHAAFMAWYKKQTEWSEDHDYNDPAVTTDALRAWFFEMTKRFPAMNGSYASHDYDNLHVTDYSIGRTVIYAAFAWSLVQEAYAAMFACAKKYRVGFFDVSANDGEVWLPKADGSYAVIHGKGRSSVEPGDSRIITITGFKVMKPGDD